MKKTMLSLIACLMAFSIFSGVFAPAFALDSNPVADNFEFNTLMSTPLYGALSGYDPDNDLTGYEITTKPIKGEIKLNDDGSFVYTPRDGKKGRDYFGYRAFDSMGNRSQEATVIIRIEKQK